MSGRLKANIIMTYCVCLYYGILFYFTKDPRLNFVVNIIIAFLVTQFTVIYASNAGKPIPSMSVWLVLATWSISMHFIFLRCKGFKGLLVSLSYLVSLSVVSAIPYIILSLIFYHDR